MSLKLHISIALCMAGVLALTTWVYWQGLNGPFVLDDLQNIVAVYTSYLNWNEIVYAATHNTSGLLGRPISSLSLYFSGIAHGPESWGYKYHNLALHLINSLLIFWFLLKLLPHMVRDLAREKVVLIAGLAAAVWLLHPLMVSTVLYAVQRMAQLSALFTLLALLSYLFVRESAIKGGCRFYLSAYLLFPVLILLAVLSKESGALIPFYVFALELIVFKFSFSGQADRNRLFCFLVVFVCLPLAAGSVYVFYNMDRFIDYSLRDFNMAERLLTQLHVLLLYLKLLLFPQLSDMTLFHDYFEVRRQVDMLTVLLFILLLLAIALIFKLRKRAPVISFAIAWFLISHLMESTFLNLELVFEHRNYLAALGPVLAVIYYLSANPVIPRLKYFSLVILVLFTFMTFVRAQEWGNEDIFYQIAVAEHPRSIRAQTHSANQNYNRGNLRAAYEHLSNAQEIWPNDVGPVMHEIVYRCHQADDFSELWEEAGRRADAGPLTTYAINGMDNLLNLVQRGYCADLSMARVIELVEKLKNQEDTLMRGGPRLGNLERIQGQAFLIEGNYVAGVFHLYRAYELTGQTSILMDLLIIQMQLGRLDDAEELLAFLEAYNQGNYGIETARLQPLRDRFEAVKQLQQRSITENQEQEN